jgi:hypothetical protein
VPLHSRMRASDRDLIREGHYGQRSCEPRKQAEHMAAPTNSANVTPTRSRPHMAQSGLCHRAERCPLLGVKRTSPFQSVMSAFDPKRTSTDSFCCDAVHSARRSCEKVVLGQKEKSHKAAGAKRHLHHGNAEPTPQFYPLLLAGLPRFVESYGWLVPAFSSNTRSTCFTRSTFQPS